MGADNNSFKRQDEDRPSFDERKNDITQFTGAKQIKPKEENEYWKWIKKMFFSGRTPKEILLDVAENQIIPQAKDNFRNSLVSIIDSSIYKDHKTTAQTSSGLPTGNFVTNYVSYSDKNKKALEENKKKDTETIKSGFETPAFKMKRDAENFIASLHAYVTKYHTMSVLDLAWMQGKRIDYTWDRYIWDEDEILNIKAPTHINHPETPWAIILPKAHELE